MARLRKSVGASNLPVTRSQSTQTSMSKTLNTSRSIQEQPPTPPQCSKDSRKRRYRPGSKALKEIRKYQRGTGLLIPKAAFRRVIKEISEELTGNSAMRFTADALECLQVASEAMVIQVFEDSVLVMINAKRMTLMVRDMQIVKRIRGGF